MVSTCGSAIPGLGQGLGDGVGSVMEFADKTIKYICECTAIEKVIPFIYLYNYGMRFYAIADSYCSTLDTSV